MHTRPEKVIIADDHGPTFSVALTGRELEASIIGLVALLRMRIREASHLEPELRRYQSMLVDATNTAAAKMCEALVQENAQKDGDEAHEDEARAEAGEALAERSTHFPNRLATGETFSEWASAALAAVRYEEEIMHPESGKRDVETILRAMQDRQVR